jgi:cytosine/adenosine deaminase-related metal-dependent hydrolase
MRLFYLLHGGRSLVRETSAQEVFDAAIHVGSQVVNRPKRNDCVLINYDALTKDAIFDDLEETEVILTRMTRQYVAGLIVDGKWVVENGKTVNIDLDECKKELRKQARSLSSQIEPSRNSVRQLQVAIRRYYAS